MLDSGKLPGLGGSTPEAECQWWADRLGDEKTRGDRLSAYEKMMPTVFPHLTRRRSPVEGAFNPGGARRGLTRRRAAQPCRVYSLLVRGEACPAGHPSRVGGGPGAVVRHRQFPPTMVCRGPAPGDYREQHCTTSCGQCHWRGSLSRFPPNLHAWTGWGCRRAEVYLEPLAAPGTEEGVKLEV